MTPMTSMTEIGEGDESVLARRPAIIDLATTRAKGLAAIDEIAPAVLGQIKVHDQGKWSEYVAGVATSLQPLTLHTRGPRRAGVTRPAPSGCPQVTEWARSAAPLWHCLSLTSLRRCISRGGARAENG